MTSKAPPPAAPPPADGDGRFALKLTSRPVDQELKTSFMDYAMSVIVSRALPDARDGLKPVHRRILHGMNELGATSDKPTRKSARIVGEVMGKYHPHGDASIYDAMARMAQDFSLRYPLVVGQGNWGCFTGDTRIKLVDGTERSFEELSRLGPEEKFFVYSVNAEGRIVVAEGRNARLTRTKAPLVEVILDSGERIHCTPDHKFLLRNGSYKEAQNLTPEDSLYAGYFDTAPVTEETNDYLRIYQPASGARVFVHHLADEYNAAHGLANRVAGPFVRHHANFNRFDNRPANVVRLGFVEHFHVHAAHARRMWESPEFRKAQREGAQAYYRAHPEAIQASRARLIAHNKDPDFRKANGQKVSRSLRRRYQDPAERAKVSTRAKNLWANESHRTRMIKALTTPPKRPLLPEAQDRVRDIISAKSRAMWADEVKREKILVALRAATSTDEFRRASSVRAQALWKTAAFRSKYAADHHRRMSQAALAKPGIRAFYSEKMRRQQTDPAFRAKMAEAASRTSRARQAEQPDLMRKLAARAARVLLQKWKTQQHRRQVMRAKIARYGSELIRRYGSPAVASSVFDASRPGNWIPRFEKAMTYFAGSIDFAAASKNYNHRVTSVSVFQETADVYDITVDGHHNFLLSAGVFVHNSVDGDPPGAQRYTEARLSPVAMEMLADLEKETVDLVPNFDASLTEPTVLPSALPNLLVNGSSGIAVGMATNMAPHNLAEVVDATVRLIDHPESSIQDLIQIVRGPDFPTGGIIMGRAGLVEAYATGRGRVVVRSRYTEEKVRERAALVFTEIPYMVNKANLLVAIAELVKDKRVEGISDLRDESNREGIRMIVELKKDANAEVVLNQLYAHTQLQTTFSVLNLALVKNRPVVLNLKRLLEEWLEHRVSIVTRRTQFDLRKAQERAHVVEGLLIALEAIEAVIKLIKESATVEAARTGLIARYGLTDVQARAILDLRLAKLAQLEVKSLRDEHRELLARIQRYKEILGSRAEILTIIKDELRDLKKRYGDARRTEVTGEEAEEIVLEELIPVHDVVVTMTNAGYVKRSPLAAYRAQGRGGKGIIGAETKEEDFVTDLFVTSSHNHIMFFTTRGQVHWKKAYELPEGTRYGRGKAVVNLLQGLQPGERVTAAIPVAQFDDQHFVFFATRSGTVKRTALSEFKHVRAGGIRAIGLDEGDEVLGVALTDGKQTIVLTKASGKSVRFEESEVRAMGRTAVGVKGIDLEPGTRGAVVEKDEVVALAHVAGNEGDLLTMKANGRGKRTPVADYPIKGRGTKGVITIDIEESVDGKAIQSPVVGMVHVRPGDEIIVSTERGIVIRMPVDVIPQKGRGAQGNWIIRPEEGDGVVAVAKVAAESLPPPRPGQ